MKILFLVKFYPPFDRGGSEWSTHDLAYLLTKRKHQISILTPNFGAPSYESQAEGEIFRFPFPIKLNKNYQQPAPWWTTNLLWILISTYFCLKHVMKNDIDIIHVHSNEFIPAAVIVGWITQKPTVATFRDYQVICNLGFCLWGKNKSCSILDYFRNDVKFFLENYTQTDNKLVKLFIFNALIRAKIYQKILKYFALKINYKVAVSQKVSEIFKSNKIYNLKVINNPIIMKNQSKAKRDNTVIYAGKLSKGKGIDLLFKSLPIVFKRTSITGIKIIGSGHLQEKLKNMAKDFKLTSKIKFIGHIPHDEVLKSISRASITLVPSIWPEPLPRAIIESILLNTPVVATEVGGNPEILKDNLYGKISKPNEKQFALAIIKTWQKRKDFSKNLSRDIQILKKKYSQDVCDSYEKLYSLTLR